MAHWAELRADDTLVTRVIEADGVVEVSYVLVVGGRGQPAGARSPSLGRASR